MKERKQDTPTQPTEHAKRAEIAERATEAIKDAVADERNVLIDTDPVFDIVRDALAEAIDPAVADAVKPYREALERLLRETPDAPMRYENSLGGVTTAVAGEPPRALTSHAFIRALLEGGTDEH